MAQNVVGPQQGEALSEYRSKFDDFVNAYLSGLSGSTRPSNLANGGVWYNSSSSRLLLYNGSQDVPVGGLVAVNTTGVGNVGTGEDDLQSITIPANTLWANGQYIEIFAFFSTAANGNNKQAKLYFDNTLIAVSPIAAYEDSDNIILNARIYRTGASAQKVVGWLYYGSDSVGTLTPEIKYQALTKDLTTALVIKTTGEATANDDLISQVLSAKLIF